MLVGESLVVLCGSSVKVCISKGVKNAPPLPTGDHKGPPNHSLQYSPLRNVGMGLRLFARDDIGFKAFVPTLLQFGVTMVLVLPNRVKEKDIRAKESL